MERCVDRWMRDVFFMARPTLCVLVLAGSWLLCVYGFLESRGRCGGDRGARTGSRRCWGAFLRSGCKYHAWYYQPFCLLWFRASLTHFVSVWLQRNCASIQAFRLFWLSGLLKTLSRSGGVGKLISTTLGIFVTGLCSTFLSFWPQRVVAQTNSLGVWIHRKLWFNHPVSRC